ncbi:tail protein X [Kaistia sp. MMO-174]|uniref:tail protein X n=1 Tax=Kaistia sp. MMO-174 TaxID=3081256 RepID=UPI003017DDF2
MSDRYTVRRDGLRLDQVAREALGSWTNGIVEATLDRNPGLALLPTILPVGTVIDLPPRPAADPVRKKVAKIWGEA